MNETLKKYLLKLSSVRVGFFLLALLAISSVVFSFFPTGQIDGFSKFVSLFSWMSNVQPDGSISFQERFESPAFLALIAVLSFSLAASIFFRTKAEFLRLRHSQLLRPISESPESMRFQDTMPTVLKTLRHYGYKPLVRSLEEQITIVGERGGKGTFGSILFHTALLVIIAGVTLSSVASFRSSISLTEGQEFDSGRDSFGYEQGGTFYRAPQEDLVLRLIRVEPEYAVHGATTLATIVAGNSVNQEVPIYINHGIIRAKREIHQGAQTGFSPSICITQQNGDVLFKGFVRLASIHENGNNHHRDFLTFPDHDLRIEFEFLPDAVFRNGRFISRSQDLVNPLLRISVNRGSSRSEDQWISAGSAAQAGQLTLSFTEVRRWSQLDVVDDPGKNVMLLGVILGSVGLALRLLCVRKRIIVSLRFQDRKTSIDIKGTAEKFPAEFESELALFRTTLQLLLLQDTRTNQSDSPGIDLNKSKKEELQEKALP